MDIHVLRNRWIALCVRKGAWSPIAESVWEKIEARYSEAWRFYHALTHISDMLEEFDTVRHLVEDPDAIEFFIWFHDYVYDCYDPRKKDNEERSAQKADGYIFKLFGHLGWHMRLSTKVQKFIVASKHDKDPLDADARLCVDIDMSILGKPDDVFDRYEARIAEEYTPRPYTREQYRTGRVELVLKPFLARERIYYTEHFYNTYEQKARENIQRSITMLNAG